MRKRGGNSRFYAKYAKKKKEEKGGKGGGGGVGEVPGEGVGSCEWRGWGMRGGWK